MSKENLKLIMALAGIAFSFAVIVLLFFIEIPSPNAELLSMAIGVILGKCIGTVYDYEFGSSNSSDKKTDAINEVIKQQGENKPV
jgi:hypothetical protein